MGKGEQEKALCRAITCHAWNADRTQVAVCPNNNEVHIFAVSGTDAGNWTALHVLKEHDSLVSGIDWCPRTNMIVTCGHDRNAYVWKLVDNVWCPTLVILRINRAATSVKWSPSGAKFAVTSGAKAVPVCHYEQGNDWWVSKTIKKHKSTVLTLDWNRNNKFVVTGCADFKCRIFSAFIDDVDVDEDHDAWADIFPNQNRFGAQLAEFDAANGWVEAVSWSPSGYRLAFASHDSSVHIVQILAGEPPTCQTISTAFLPFSAVVFLSEDAVVFAGYDANPVLFINKGTEAEPSFEAHGVLDKMLATPGSKPKAVSSFSNARNLFDASSRMGVNFGTESTDTDGTLKTRHQNAINGLVPFWADETRYHAIEFSTCGIDGRVLLWNMSKIDGVNLADIGLA
ncbi:Actin-related protein 2/3 complex subunit [Plasmodiophora brassicae]|uniref:Actin-related protein 2/3 complex subunit n=1 Tax=Plasmodiophora brassicae TaxID=37360 RepID=A0A0G4J2E8_PLABS|nr:hypothetical protein PBRA_002150 [Plasmodiophora brassicae]SPQ93182.1 unnamed protein product [Plasmodiophora brassicae]